MGNQEIHEPKNYSEDLRKLLTTDPAHADTFNPLFERLINNDAFMKALIERSIQEHDHSGSNGKGSKIPFASIDVPAAMGGGLVTAKDLVSHAETRNPHGTTASDVGAPTKEQFTEHLAEKATQSALGHVKPDGSTTAVDATGTISVVKLPTARTIDGMAFDGSTNITHYATSSTAASTAAKTATLSGFTLATGAEVKVKFTNANTVASPTLNVNSTGAKAIYLAGANVGVGAWSAGEVVELVYNGTQYEIVGGLNGKITTLQQSLDTHSTERASLTEVGHTQLSSELDSVDETKAATPKAIKQAIELTKTKNVLAGDTPVMYGVGKNAGLTQSETYVKVATYQILGLNGQLRVSFKLKSGSTSPYAYGRVGRNGVMIGTEAVTQLTTGFIKEQDLDGWKDGDTLEFWARTSNSNYSATIFDVVVGINTIKQVI